MSKGRRKHVPQRTCVACRRTLPKRELNRIVRSPDGVRYDPTGKAPGRGAYLCGRLSCWQSAIERGVLDRAVKTKLRADERTALLEIARQVCSDQETPTP